MLIIHTHTSHVHLTIALKVAFVFRKKKTAENRGRREQTESELIINENRCMYVITAACLNPVHHVSVCQEWRERYSEPRERHVGRSRSAYSELKETDDTGTDTGRGEEDSRCRKML